MAGMSVIYTFYCPQCLSEAWSEVSYVLVEGERILLGKKQQQQQNTEI